MPKVLDKAKGGGATLVVNFHMDYPQSYVAKVSMSYCPVDEEGEPILAENPALVEWEFEVSGEAYEGGPAGKFYEQGFKEADSATKACMAAAAALASMALICARAGQELGDESVRTAAAALTMHHFIKEGRATWP